jgi:hypothetical protein
VVDRLADVEPAEQGRPLLLPLGHDEVHPQPAGQLGDGRLVVRLDQPDHVRPLPLDDGGQIVEPADAAVEDVVADDPHGE